MLFQYIKLYRCILISCWAASRIEENSCTQSVVRVKGHQGFIQSPGYPAAVTTRRCQWNITPDTTRSAVHVFLHDLSATQRVPEPCDSGLRISVNDCTSSCYYTCSFIAGILYFSCIFVDCILYFSCILIACTFYFSCIIIEYYYQRERMWSQNHSLIYLISSLTFFHLGLVSLPLKNTLQGKWKQGKKRIRSEERKQILQRWKTNKRKKPEEVCKLKRNQNRIEPVQTEPS